MKRTVRRKRYYLLRPVVLEEIPTRCQNCQRYGPSPILFKPKIPLVDNIDAFLEMKYPLI